MYCKIVFCIFIVSHTQEESSSQQ